MKCPYCGRDNKEGIAFQKQVRNKEERNRRLVPNIMRKNAKWLSNKMLTRMIFITAVVKVLLFVICFIVFLWSDRDTNREAKAGSQAQLYISEFRDGDYYFSSFLSYANRMIDAMEAGNKPDLSIVKRTVEEGYDVAREKEEYSAEEKEQVNLLLLSLF